MAKDLMPISRLVIDIETADADEEAILAEEQRMRDSERNYKPATIAKVRERAALLDAAPIICVAVRSELSGVIFTWMPVEAKVAADLPVLVSPDERSMLQDLAECLDATTDENTLPVAHSAGFDVKHLRLRYAHHNLARPAILDPVSRLSQDFFCTMEQFSYEFSLDMKDGYIALAEACRRVGILDLCSKVPGEMIPEFYRRKQYLEILEHCAQDTRATEALYLRMCRSNGTGGLAAAPAAPAAPEVKVKRVELPPVEVRVERVVIEAESVACREILDQLASAGREPERLGKLSAEINRRRGELRNGEFQRLRDLWRQAAEAL